MRHKANVNILLVDDQPHNLLELESILESLGQNVVKADSGEAALRYLRTQEFALILLDVQMPEMDGLETAKRIRDKANGQYIPVIFIADSNRVQTGRNLGDTREQSLWGKPSKPRAKDDPSDTDVLKAYALGAVDYLFKPIVPQILRSKVTAWISLFQKTQVLKQRTAQLETALQEFQDQSDQRKQAELALQELNQQLELRVQQRTAELQQANKRLQAEVEERRQAAAALRTSEARYKAIVENSYDIITFTDDQDNIYYQNSTRERILGYPVTESSCKRPVHEVHRDDITRVQAPMSAILAQPGVPITVEYRMKRADGSWAWLESVATNWLSNPDIRAIVANSRDMSEHKQAQEVLRQQTQRERLIAASIQRIRETLDLDVILATTVEEVRQFLQVDRVLVYRIWPDSTGSTIA